MKDKYRTRYLTIISDINKTNTIILISYLKHMESCIVYNIASSHFLLESNLLETYADSFDTLNRLIIQYSLYQFDNISLHDKLQLIL